MPATAPLSGLRVVEMAGLGPGPLAATLLADLGADVVRIERPGMARDEIVRRRRRVVLDLSRAEGRDRALALIGRAEALIEGFRPGVMERLGLGPEEVHAANPGLTYVRITGWGQTGPLSREAGHDINYIALSGVLGRIGTEQPVVPLNLVADYGGGAMFAVAGLLAGVTSTRAGAPGRVVDVAMTEGSAYLMTKQFAWHQTGMTGRRGTTVLDGNAAWYYGTYRCADGRFIAVGAIEARFRKALASLLGIDNAGLPDDSDPANWPLWRKAAAERILARTRDEWVAAAADLDACLTPVLDLDEVPSHPQFRARNSFILEHGGTMLPGVAPRFPDMPGPAPGVHDEPVDIDGVLRDWTGQAPRPKLEQ